MVRGAPLLQTANASQEERKLRRKICSSTKGNGSQAKIFFVVVGLSTFYSVDHLDDGFVAEIYNHSYMHMLEHQGHLKC